VRTAAAEAHGLEGMSRWSKDRRRHGQVEHSIGAVLALEMRQEGIERRKVVARVVGAGVVLDLGREALKVAHHGSARRANAFDELLL